MKFDVTSEDFRWLRIITHDESFVLYDEQEFFRRNGYKTIDFHIEYKNQLNMLLDFIEDNQNELQNYGVIVGHSWIEQCDKSNRIKRWIGEENVKSPEFSSAGIQLIDSFLMSYVNTDEEPLWCPPMRIQTPMLCEGLMMKFAYDLAKKWSQYHNLKDFTDTNVAFFTPQIRILHKFKPDFYLKSDNKNPIVNILSDKPKLDSVDSITVLLQENHEKLVRNCNTLNNAYPNFAKVYSTN